MKQLYGIYVVIIVMKVRQYNNDDCQLMAKLRSLIGTELFTFWKFSSFLLD